MNAIPKLVHDAEAGMLERYGSGEFPLWRYVYRPDSPSTEAPRPYLHPVRSIHGDVLTQYRPNDHPWHHGLNMTLTHVAGVNFWGGPTHSPADGYRWREDQGIQVHRDWLHLDAERIEQNIDWIDPRRDLRLLQERRLLETQVECDGWSLRWKSQLRNATEQKLELGNYHSLGGLAGSHYTGLQFRGARGLLDEHGDQRVEIIADGELVGEKAVHGAVGRWMEWHCQCDTSLNRVRIRFEVFGEHAYWFVRRNNPLAAISFHRERPVYLGRGEELTLDQKISFMDF